MSKRLEGKECDNYVDSLLKHINDRTRFTDIAVHRNCTQPQIGTGYQFHTHRFDRTAAYALWGGTEECVKIAVRSFIVAAMEDLMKALSDLDTMPELSDEPETTGR